MPYLVLARKSRPQRFADVLGHKTAVRTLQNALLHNRVAHSILFSGVRGTGKTTLARIMAKALNCTNRKGAEPCNTCPSCMSMNEGASVDLQEIDGASNRGIQEIRDIKERLRFQPSNSRYKIFIIDEVHMLTNEAFNALLKTLEEPPDHVYFMFATTEPHKVPLTILSRCQRYELKRLSKQELTSHFSHLATQEGVQMDPQAVEMIVRESEGSVRDGLSLLDQLFSYCGNTVTAKDVLDVLGLVTSDLIYDIGVSLLAADLGTAFHLVGSADIQGVDIKRLGADLLQWFRGLLLCKLGGEAASLLELTQEQVKTMTETVAPYSLMQLSAVFNVLMDTLEQNSLSLQPKLALELACIRAVQTADITPVAELISRLDKLFTPAQARPSEHLSTRPVTRQVDLLSKKKAIDEQAPQVHERVEMISPAQEPNEPAAQAPLANLPPTSLKPPLEKKREPDTVASHPLPTVESQSETAVISPPATPAKKGESTADIALQIKVRREWESFIQYVQQQKKWIALALQQSLSISVEGMNLTILFRDGADCIMLKKNDHLRELNTFALDFYQEPLTIRIEEVAASSCEINPITGRTPQEERNALAADPLVQTALEVFNGQLRDIRIGNSYKKPYRQVEQHLAIEEDEDLQED